MLKLLYINSLLSVNTIAAKVEIITLAYSITSSGFRNIPLIDKITAVVGPAPATMNVDWGNNIAPCVVSRFHDRGR